MNLCELTGRAFNFLYDYYKFINLNKTINITSIESDHIVVDRSLKIYAFKLEGYSNYQENLRNIEALRSAYMFSDSRVQLMTTVVKTKNYQGSYLFCTNEDLALSLESELEVKMLSGQNILNALFDSYLINDYFINNEKRMESSLSVELDEDFFKEELDIESNKPLVPMEWDVLYYKGKEIMKEATYNISENYNIYQSFRFKNRDKIDYSKLYKADWEGVVYLFFDLSYKSALSLSRVFKNKTKDEGGLAYKHATDLYKITENKEIDVCLANSLMALKEPTSLATVSNILGIDYIKKSVQVQEILAKTLLQKRDIEKNSLIRTRDIGNFIAKVHKKEAATEIEGKKVDIDFYGKDINGAYVNYIFRENSNPHAMLIAGSGSGKSLSIQKILTQIIDYQVKARIANKIKEKQIRYFDVGFSGQKFISALKEKYPEYVDEIEPSLNDLRFNLIDIKRADNREGLEQDDLTFKLSIFDMILECSHSNKLRAEEYSLIKESVAHLYEEKVYERVSLGNLKDDGFVKLINELIALGYSEYDTIDDIKEEHEYLVKEIKKPTLKELYEYLSSKAKDLSLTTQAKENIQNTMQKVETVNSLGTFSKHPYFQFGTNNVVYFDVNTIKSDERLFAPIYMFILMSYYNNDREQALDIRLKRKATKFKDIPQSYYIIEEAHNFMRYDSFKKTFDILSREARKYGVHMIFISQRPEDIPESTIGSIATRIFMAEKAKKEEFITGIEKHIGMSEDVKWTFENTEDYQMLVIYDKGVFGCKFDITPEEIKLFSTAA